MGGFDVRLFEEHPSLGSPAHCAGLVGPGMASLPEIGGLVRDCTINRIRGATFASPNGTKFSVEGGPDSALVLDRRLFDRRLGEEAARCGATIELRSKVCGIRGNTIDVVTEGSHGELESKVVVGATGSRFAIASMLGARDGNMIPGIQFEVTKLSVDEEMVHLYFGKGISEGLFCWVIPLDSSTARIGLCSRQGAKERLNHLLETRIKQDFGKGKVMEVSAGAVAYGLRDRTVWGNVLLVGDEALQTKPSTGGGIHFSIICSGIAADSIAEHLALARDLQCYESDWRRVLEKEIRFGLMVRRIFEDLRDAEMNRLFAAVLPRDRRVLAGADFDRHSTIGRALPGFLPRMARQLGLARLLALSAKALFG
jgi:digeranylgeranylglycerophospholipid reductase